MRVALFALAVLIAATISSVALGQVVRRPDLGPQTPVEVLTPSLGGTWQVPIQLLAHYDGTLTLTPRANNRLTGIYNSVSHNARFTCRGRFNRVKFALYCESDAPESVHNFFMVGEAQIVAAIASRGGGAGIPASRRLTGQLHVPHLFDGAPAGHTVSVPFEGTA